MFDVITVGSSTLDIFTQTEFSEMIKISDARHEEKLLAYPSGSKILINHIEQTTGGSGTNTGAALSRLGHKVGYLGRIGNDSNGKIILEDLKKEKITNLSPLVKGHSGYSVILETLDGDRTILTHKGVNDGLQFKEVPMRKLKTKWFYFGTMMGTSFKTQEKIAAYAAKNGIHIAFNPSAYLARKGRAHIDSILKHTTLLAVNKEEAGYLTGRHNIKDMLKTLYSYGPTIVLVTDGKKGAHAYDGHHHYSCVPPSHKVLDTTGAGDAFASSVVSGIMRKRPLDQCMKMGLINSQAILEHYGAKNNLLKRSAMDKKMKSLRVRVKKVKL